jgi:single-strand DNA-binding protein
MNLNKVFVLGRLTADPQLRVTATGNQVATFSIATNRIWTDKVSGKREETEYHNIVVWGRQAEIAQQFLAKGGLVLVEGRLQTRTWDDKQGQKRKTTEIISERIQLGPRPAHRPQPAAEIPTISLDDVPASAVETETAPNEIKLEDLPF